MKKYTFKLFDAKKKVKVECQKKQIKTPDENKLDELILYHFGNWQSVLYTIREAL